MVQKNVHSGKSTLTATISTDFWYLPVVNINYHLNTASFFFNSDGQSYIVKFCNVIKVTT